MTSDDTLPPRFGLPDPGILALLRELTDGLTAGLDAAHVANALLAGCVQHTAVREAGLVLDDGTGDLQILAATTLHARELALLELRALEGPCLGACRTGQLVSSADLHRETERWPRFAPAALAAGIRQAHAVPLRLGDTTIGALNLFVAEGAVLPAEHLVFAEILAGAAALGLITRRQLGRSTELARELQGALDSRVIIEQAKGVLASRTGLDMVGSFEILRRQARHERRALREVAAEIVSGATKLRN